MITIFKLAGLSAVLSAGVVTAYEAPKAPAPDSGKIYHDRIAPDAPISLADASSVITQKTVMSDASPDCGAQIWPYVASTCIANASDAPARKAVRTITIERRDAPNTSTLVRLPAETAPRR
ncbi:hypothetical protein [uncultured Enterovirga sp.]|uniref:hypothetical protein n=1 Tax=uncultured Enterovirga sp. TaxID=2026352 RepID=UPI0035C9B981